MLERLQGLRRGSGAAGKACRSPVPTSSRPRAPLLGCLFLSAVLRVSKSHRVQGGFLLTNWSNQT